MGCVKEEWYSILVKSAGSGRTGNTLAVAHTRGDVIGHMDRKVWTRRKAPGFNRSFSTRLTPNMFGKDTPLSYYTLGRTG
jgi:hypothetical protein